MNNEIKAAEIYYHGAGWAARMAECSALARKSIHISTLSLLQPTQNATGDWPELWRTWCAAARRGVAVHFWLPAPTAIHPATKGNIGAGRAIVAEGMHAHFVQGSRLLHAKTAVIDRASVWIGSGNFTAAAAHHNYEAYLHAVAPKFAEQIITRWESLA